jgi:hypothetical protein
MWTELSIVVVDKGLTHGYHCCCCEGNFLGKKHVASFVVVEKVTSENETKLKDKRLKRRNVTFKTYVFGRY